eukprot:1182973-Prorocentrum_minimum.AAC.3
MMDPCHVSAVSRISQVQCRTSISTWFCEGILRLRDAVFLGAQNEGGPNPQDNKVARDRGWPRPVASRAKKPIWSLMRTTR